MEELKSRLKNLIVGLPVDDPKKSELLAMVESEGVTQNTLNITGEYLKKLIEDYEEEALKEAQKIEEELMKIKADFKNELEDIKRRKQDEEKAANKKKDEEQLEALRKQLQ